MKRACQLSMGFPRYLKWCAILVVMFFIIESIIFNTVVFYFMWKFGSVLTQFANAPGHSLLDKLADFDQFRDVVNSGKEGGFNALLQNTLGRVYIESLDTFEYGYHCQNASSSVPAQQTVRLPYVSKIGVDVSNSGEALFILRRIKQRQQLSTSNMNWEHLIVDIGANDGLLSSNSYNFIHWGWSAVLVEPQNYQLDLAKQNLNGFTNQHEKQNVHFVNAIVGEKNGFVDFVLSSDIVSMESHVVRHQESNPESNAQTVVKVQSFTVTALSQQYGIPKRFGILSVDAEGMSNVILRQWIDHGYRPMYILYESLHENEPISVTKQYLAQNEYTYLAKLGWNHIFEYYGK